MKVALTFQAISWKRFNMSENKLYISAAGSGKTTMLINNALLDKSSNILITTYTIENKQSIINRFFKINKCIPANITVQTWFSFLLEHCLKPYRFWPDKISGLYFNDGRSAPYIPETNLKKHFFTNNNEVYRDKIAKLAYRCNENSNGYVIKRLEHIYSSIYIDEIQDLSGYDLELIKLFIESNINIIMVGDPRQCAYETHNESKNSKYRNGKIHLFLKEKCKNLPIEIDTTSLNCSYRNSSAICHLANSLYDSYPPCKSSQIVKNEHNGVFLLKRKYLNLYMSLFCPQQLRYMKNNELEISSNILNFGESKGLEFPHVLIFPTDKFLKWIKNRNTSLPDGTRSKIYIAITRAFFSVAIVVDDNYVLSIPDIDFWVPKD